LEDTAFYRYFPLASLNEVGGNPAMPGFSIEQFHRRIQEQASSWPHTMLTTGTHDTDTAVGWWQTLGDYERRNAETYLGPCPDGIHWGLIRAAISSMSSLSVIPMQDVLGLGSDARMNRPSVPTGNWAWRLTPGAINDDLAWRLAHLAEVTDRLPEQVQVGPNEEFAA
jgi:4-alpha-glucanotransferase